MNARLTLKGFSCCALLFAAGCGDGGDQANDKSSMEEEMAKFHWEGTFAEREAAFMETFDGNSTILLLRDSLAPFTGSITSHGLEGELRVFRYKEGRRHGLCVLRDKSGGRTEANYWEGVEHGSFVIFGRNGGERFRWRYENGRKVRE